VVTTENDAHCCLREFQRVTHRSLPALPLQVRLPPAPPLRGSLPPAA
jgi:hypothetical protein